MSEVNKLYREIGFILILVGCYYIVYYLITHRFPNFIVTSILFAGVILTKIFFAFLKIKSRSTELDYHDEVAVLPKIRVFIRVFSCPIPENLPEIPLISFFAPLTIEILPLKNEIHFFFYSQNLEELKSRCKLARKNLSRSIPSIKLLSSFQLKQIFTKIKVLSIKKEKYLEQNNKLFAHYNPPLGEALGAFKEYWHWYLQKYSHNGEIRVVLPFITQKSLIETKKRSDVNPTTEWSTVYSQNKRNSTVFRGIEIYANIVEFFDPQTLEKNLDKAYESIRENNFQGFNQESDPFLALRAKIRYPSKSCKEFPIDLGIQYFSELLKIINRKKRISFDKTGRATKLYKTSLETVKSIPTPNRGRESPGLSSIPAQIDLGLEPNDLSYFKPSKSSLNSSSTLPKLIITYHNRSPICNNCQTAINPTECLKNLKNAFKVVQQSQNLLLHLNDPERYNKVILDKINHLSVKNNITKGCLLVVLEATVGHSKISFLQKNIEKSKTTFLTSHNKELSETSLDKFCIYCSFQNASKNCQNYKSQVKVKIDSMKKDMAIKMEEINIDNLPIFFSQLDEKWQKDACMLRTILFTLLNIKDKERSMPDKEKKEIITAVLQIFNNIRSYDPQPPLTIRV
ncbi:MAG: hypothetical protein ACFFDI_16275 [Promethearchaeota archaeon]